METVHNHEISKQFYQLYHTNRKIPEEYIELSKAMLQTGSKPSKVALHISKLCNKIVDLHNLAASKSLSKVARFDYFKNNWLNCVDKWAKFKRYGLPLNLQETNNPLEVMNKQIKAYSTKHSSSSLSKCLSYILEYIKTSELNKLYVNTVQPNKKTDKQGLSNSQFQTIQLFHQYLSLPIASWLEKQLELSQMHPYSYEKSANDNEFVIKISKNEYVIKNVFNDTTECSCYEQLSLNLPCRYICLFVTS
ncbi:unnamed protein product [Brachionus calyciflorus]|uniref:SWIM-type domain-containing protein n=1 Tax=Brachionus calyciflorus TaxID=104777 RepID=A0A814CRM7_9BILA|nr:unnamed protein product [Brachionus calyciflorus]